MCRYAARSMSMQSLLVAPEIGEAWEEFSSRVASHNVEMRGHATKIYYPSVPGAFSGDAHKALVVVNATEPVVRFARSSKDCVAGFAHLTKDLGSSQAGLLGALMSSVVLGGAIGAEVANWLA